MIKEYVLYRGDKYLTQGTIKMIQKYLGKSKDSVYRYSKKKWIKDHYDDPDALLLFEIKFEPEEMAEYWKYRPIED